MGFIMYDTKIKMLIEEALDIRKNAYAPYSKFMVGAALLTVNGKVYTGTNVENSSYPVGICAERNVLSYAVSQGERGFEMLAVVGGKFNENPLDLKQYCYPCGMCRQFISELCGDDFSIIIARNLSDYKSITMGELLPKAFENLKQ